MLALLAAGVLAAGGLAACGDDDDTTDTGGAETTDTGEATDTGEEGDTGGESANPEVQEYCDAVTEYVDSFDPEDPEMAAESQALVEQGTDLATADLSAEDAQAVGECTQQLTELATGG